MPRQDYKEVMKLCLLILGDKIYRFTQSGAHHEARWMAKDIDCFNIHVYVFGDQF